MSSYTFSEQLRTHQARLELTQQGMADALGVSLRTYCDWIRAASPVVPHELMQEGALARLNHVAPRKSPRVGIPEG